MLTTLDYIVLAGYVVGITVFGLKAGGKQKSASDYFLGGRDLPWWAVCFSVVATETSTLTVISVPAVAYGGSLVFLQLTFGYLIGRVIVSFVFLPRYFDGEMTTAYAYLGQRFGDKMRVTASLTFLLTRLLADGVRLFATAIPLRVIATSMGFDVGYGEIILGIGLVTIAYTLVGGIKAVVWMDAVQMLIYVGGAIFAVFVLLGDVPAGWFSEAAAAGKTQVFDLGLGQTFSDWITSPYIFWTALIGGAIFSMASHGTDQLIVQRLLTCRTLADSKKALIWSGAIVMFQFALFLVVGLLLWAHYGGASIAELGLTRSDEIFPRFIIEGLPPGVSGLILAGIIAAAMSTLSSSLNSLASSTLFDLYERISGKQVEGERAVFLSRVMTFFWGFVFIGFAMLFTDTSNPVVELGLSIASFTYGGLLGAFMLGLLNRKVNERDAIIAFIVTILCLVWLVRGFWYTGAAGGWVSQFIGPWSPVPAGLTGVAWPLYPVIGTAITLLVGGLLSLRYKGPAERAA